MADQSSARFYVGRYVLARRGGINASGKPGTRVAKIYRLTRNGEALRGKFLWVGGAKHGHLATGFVTIDLHTIEADWSSMPHQTEVQAARQEVSKMTVQDEHGCWVA